jgi:hypothetical protein
LDIIIAFVFVVNAAAAAATTTTTTILSHTRFPNYTVSRTDRDYSQWNTTRTSGELIATSKSFQSVKRRLILKLFKSVCGLKSILAIICFHAIFALIWVVTSFNFPQQNLNIRCYPVITLGHCNVSNSCCSNDTPLSKNERTQYISAPVALVSAQCSTIFRPC